MPLIETKGAASSQGFGQFASTTAPVYIEDVFSTYLYTGSFSATNIVNGIDLSSKGGLVWTKSRNGSYSHNLVDTARGSSALFSNLTDSQASGYTWTANSNGYTLSTTDNTWNNAYSNYVSWTFRKQPKFFDVVTYTGNGVSGRQIAHSLGVAPGCVIVKTLNASSDWIVSHWTNGASRRRLLLNGADASDSLYTYVNGFVSSASDTGFTVSAEGSSISAVNANGLTYVAYLFAHDAGGFGLSGTDNVISCGSFSVSVGSSATVNLGYEPQWLLVKDASSSGSSWMIYDTMRGWSLSSYNILFPDLSIAEDVSAATNRFPTSTGFSYYNGGGGPNFIYLAIRRGPMKVPTSGTSVFAANLSGTYDAVNTTNFPIDAQIWAVRGGISRNSLVVDRLRGVGTGGTTNDGVFMSTSLADAEIGTGSNSSRSWDNTGFRTPGYAGSVPEVFWSFRRAPGFFDVVCWTGNGSNPRTINHNLGVSPEFIITKDRSAGYDWWCYHQALSATKYVVLNLTSAAANSTANWSPTSTSFLAASWYYLNNNNENYVAYLFASCPGVSKVGSYTGTGTTQQINCGFTGGARFVLIKRTDSTGDWYVWDSARGIVAGNDPYLLLNNTAAEVTNTDYIDTLSTGFEISSTAPAAINGNGGTFIYLAIA